jgi:hypothetical protein
MLLIGGDDFEGRKTMKTRLTKKQESKIAEIETKLRTEVDRDAKIEAPWELEETND